LSNLKIRRGQGRSPLDATTACLFTIRTFAEASRSFRINDKYFPRAGKHKTLNVTFTRSFLIVYTVFVVRYVANISRGAYKLLYLKPAYEQTCA